ncbi:MAG: ABC-type transport system, involved in lipoprotein release, permease component, partial [Paenibacillaceae bacterium]|nr:ABC-type transport system, involved in lipoprotein release, permease component [Paenibacillaceae bacterium]
MKSYLDLIPIFAKVHQKQNRMTLTCIVLAVFLVTAVFGMADMAIRSQRLQVIKTTGSWHVMISGAGEEEAGMIRARPEVTSAGNYAYLDTKQSFTVAGKTVQLGGVDRETFEEMLPSRIVEGAYPLRAHEVALSENAKFSMNAQVGDILTLERPEIGPLQVTVAGFMEGTSTILSRGTYIVLFSEDGFRNAVP